MSHLSFLPHGLAARWNHELFEADVSQRGWGARTAIFWIRFWLVILDKFRDGGLHWRSTSLAYTTLLSLVPFLAVAFSLLKGFGAHNRMEPVLLQLLEPLGDKGAEIGSRILSYVDNLNFAVLGFTGICLTFWTVISLLTRVEESFNAIWQVPGVRTWGRRFSDYLSLSLVGPLFMVAGLGTSKVVFDYRNLYQEMGNEVLSGLLMTVSQLIPFLLVSAAFGFVYAFLTNCRVRPLPALAAGVFTSLAWYGIGHLFAELVVSSSRYSAIYSSVAAAVLFIIWVNIGWLIVLVGAHIARYWQYPHLLTLGKPAAQGNGGRDEVLALQMMVLIGHAYHVDGPKWTLGALAAGGCCGSPDRVAKLLQSLRAHRLVVATNEVPEAYLPGRSLESIGVGEILAAARGRESNRLRVVQEVVEQLDAAAADRVEGKTLRDLVMAQGSIPVAVVGRRRRAEEGPAAVPAPGQGQDAAMPSHR